MLSWWGRIRQSPSLSFFYFPSKMHKSYVLHSWRQVQNTYNLVNYLHNRIQNQLTIHQETLFFPRLSNAIMPHTVQKLHFSKMNFTLQLKPDPKPTFARLSSLGFHTSSRRCEHNIQLQIHGQCAWLWHWTSEAGCLIFFDFLRKTSVTSLPLFFNYLELKVMPLNTTLMKWKGTSETLKEGREKHETKMVTFLLREGIRRGRWGQQQQLKPRSFPCLPCTVPKEL